MASPIHFDESLRLPAQDKQLVGRALEIVRERSERYGEVVIPARRVRCGDCGKHFDVVTMPRFRSSGVVGPVMDILCKDCGDREWRTKGFRHPRLVCVGCREVVRVEDVPRSGRSVDPNGFAWEVNKFYHVQECPSCAKRALRCSEILEIVAYCRRRGIATH